MPKLLDFIAQQSSASSRVEWVVSSRNWPNIEERLGRAGHKVRLSLELNAESVSEAVSLFIEKKGFPARAGEEVRQYYSRRRAKISRTERKQHFSLGGASLSRS